MDLELKALSIVARLSTLLRPYRRIEYAAKSSIPFFLANGIRQVATVLIS